MLTILLFLFLTAMCAFKLQKHKSKTEIPGPPGVPLLGNLPQLSGNLHLTCFRWVSKYGKLFKIHMGARPALVISDSKLMQNLLDLEASTERFGADFLHECSDGYFSLENSEGTFWLEQRQAVIKLLRRFGFDQASKLEEKILEDANDLCNYIEVNQKCNGIFYATKPIRIFTSRVLINMINKKWESEDQDKLSELVASWTDAVIKTAACGTMFFPWLRRIAPGLTGFNNLKVITDKLFRCISKCFDERERFDEDSPPEDLVDGLIDENRNCSIPTSFFYGKEGLKNSCNTVAGWIIAGGASHGGAINWILFYLSSFQNIQRKVQAEISSAISGKVRISFQDISRMSYLEAVVLESFRFSTLSPLGIMRELKRDIMFSGYFLPKGMILISYLYYMHNDQEIWGDPEKFRPERFLAENGSQLRKHVVIFQGGKRVCPGRHTAKIIIMYFVAVLFNKFSFTLDPTVDPMQYLKPVSATFMFPKELGLKVTKNGTA